MKKQMVRTMIEKWHELKPRQFLGDTRESIADTKRRLLLRRFPRTGAQAPVVEPDQG